MGRITTLFVHKIVAQVHPDLDHGRLLRSVGVDPDAPVDAKRMIPDDDYYGLLERIAAVDPDAIDLPLRTGASMRCDEYGALGLAMKSALTLRGSYERAERYARVLTNVAAYEVRDVDGGALILLHRDGPRRLGLRLSNEATIASLVEIGKQVSTAPFQPLEIFFKHPAPREAEAHARHFGCPVRFGTEHDALLASSAALATPNRLGDPSISRFFDTHLQQALSQLHDETTLERRVRGLVAQALSEGVPRVSSVAQQLGMSGRTLQRRLSAAGSSYQALVDQARRELAARLLRDTTYSLAEVAFLTGFSEQSAFTRAFKRWAGQTPRSFRLSASST